MSAADCLLAVLMILTPFKLADGPASHETAASLQETVSRLLNKCAVFSEKLRNFVKLHLEFVLTNENWEMGLIWNV